MTEVWGVFARVGAGDSPTSLLHLFATQESAAKWVASEGRQVITDLVLEFTLIIRRLEVIQ
jgi:hypothetical protein